MKKKNAKISKCVVALFNAIQDKPKKEVLSILEQYKQAHLDEGWEEGFNCGMDSAIEEDWEAAKRLGDDHVETYSEIFDEVERKWAAEPDVVKPTHSPVKAD